jgi:hypothetical protein
MYSEPRLRPGTHAEDGAHAGYGLRAGRGEHRVGGAAAVFAGARYPRRDQWLGVAAPAPIRLSIAASACVTVAIRAPASE